MSDLYGFINNFSKRVMRRGRDKAAEPGASAVANESDASGADPKPKQHKAKGGSRCCLWITLGIILLVIVLALGGLVLTVALTPDTFAKTPVLDKLAELFKKKDAEEDETP
uniref:Uncharacterized protein n=1 Tax=Globodera rostochiensis TaxID=31243 RepID=A0A914HDJ9_GLORO